jgi:hypothetical protein
MMRRLFIVLGALTMSTSLTGGQDELLEQWNRFARDTNSYINGLNAGVKDLRMRKKVMAEWESMTKCECW